MKRKTEKAATAAEGAAKAPAAKATAAKSAAAKSGVATATAAPAAAAAGQPAPKAAARRIAVKNTPASAPASAPVAAPSRLDVLRREIDRLFDVFDPGEWRLPMFGLGNIDMRLPKWADMAHVPAMNLVEKADGYALTVELPGLEEKDVEVKVSNGILFVKGEKSETEEKDEADYHLSERRFGQFQRSFRIPDDVAVDRIDAALAHGVLSVALPKAADTAAGDKKIAVRKG